MSWEWLNRRVKKGRSGASDAENRQPAVCWVAAADNPWGVPVLDVRPVTLQMLALSADPKCAQNAMSFGQDDGTSFIGIEPAGLVSIPVGLRFPIDRILADGALFVPSQMEHKWAIYFHREHMIFIRSWRRKVQVVARIETQGDYIEVAELRGHFAESEEEPSRTRRVLDFLLRSHALNTVYPAPLPRARKPIPQKRRLGAFRCSATVFNSRHRTRFPRFLPSGPCARIPYCTLLSLAANWRLFDPLSMPLCRQICLPAMAWRLCIGRSSTITQQSSSCCSNADHRLMFVQQKVQRR